MTGLERRLARKSKRTNLQRSLMLALHRASSPSVMKFFWSDEKLLATIDPDYKKKRNPAYRMQQAMQRLTAKGYIEKLKDSSAPIMLTAKGKEYIQRLYLSESMLRQTKRRWDGRWRMVIFDIWERRHGVRDKMRRVLTKIGFKKVQNSVWVYPYDCEELLMFLRADLRLGKSTLYIIASEIENDAHLRRLFGLQRVQGE